ncbi:Family with sequence similarity 162 member A [Pristimantis euphronides]
MLGAVIRRSGACLLAGRAVGIRRSAVPIPQLLVSKRWQCSKPEAEKTKSDDQPFRVPGHRPTNLEKKLLLWTGRFKKESDIPEFVSFEMVDAAKNKMRIRVATMMMLMTIVGCIVMVISGKKAARQQETLVKLNLEKKARLREEDEK